MGLIAPLINGFYHAYADAEIVANGLPYGGVVAANYSDNLNRAKVRGTGSVPLGLTRGAYEAKGDVEMLLEAFAIMTTALGPFWRQVPLIFNFSYVPIGLSPIPLITDTVIGYIGEVTFSGKVSDDALTRKFTLHIPGQILWNNGALPSVLDQNLIGVVG